jgi:hypothetical protein
MLKNSIDSMLLPFKYFSFVEWMIFKFSLFDLAKTFKKETFAFELLIKWSKTIKKQFDNVLNITGGGMKQKSDGSTTFCFGNCTLHILFIYALFGKEIQETCNIF